MIEKSIHNQTQDDLHRNELLHIYQSGFRANHSTDICFSQLLEMILNGAENGKNTSMILTDLQKASDTLNHKILLQKMKCTGFMVHWFHSQLTHRGGFFVSFDNVFCKTGTIHCRVPQGSILGPLLFCCIRK